MYKKFLLVCKTMNHYKQRWEDREFCFDTKEELVDFITNGTQYTKPEDIKAKDVFELNRLDINAILNAKKYYEAQIVCFDENNVPETKRCVCVKSKDEPTEEDFKEAFSEIFDDSSGDEIRYIRKISEEDAIEEHGDEIIEL